MRALLVATVRNEGPYLLEWVAHHRLVGFTDIVVFQNDSTDGTQKILRTMAARGILRYFTNESPHRAWQNRAYRRVSRMAAYAETDWVMALDADEFLNVHVGDGSVRALIEAVEADVIHLNWRCFGPGAPGAGPVTQRLTRAEPAGRVAHGWTPHKTLFRPSLFKRPGIHVPKEPQGPARIVNGSGLSDYPRDGWLSQDPGLRALAQVDHHPPKDPAAYLVKTDRGSAGHPDRELGLAYWRRFDIGVEEARGLADRAPALVEEMAALDRLSRGRLSRLTREAREAHARILGKVRATETGAALWSALTGSE